MKISKLHKSVFSSKEILTSAVGFMAICMSSMHSGAQETGWKYTGHSEPVYGVATSSDGYIYTASQDNEVHKLDAQGNVEWVYTEQPGYVNAVTVDHNGYIYTAGEFEAHKIDPSGNRVWIYDDFISETFDVKIDSSGNIYYATTDIGSGIAGGLQKVDSNGNQIWEYEDHGNNVRGIDLDDQGNVFTASEDGEVHKIDSSGNQLWTHQSPAGNDFYDVCVGPDGNVYAAGADSDIHKLKNDDGNWISTYQNNSFIMNIEADDQGYVYIATIHNKVKKIDTAFDDITWAYLGHTNDVIDIALADNGDVYSASFDDEVHQLIYNENEQPAKPGLTSPEHNAEELDLTPLFEWEDAQNAHVYHLEVDDTHYFTNSEIEEDSITQTQFAAQDSLEPDEGYHWKVRAVNEHDFASEWSDRFEFETAGSDAEDDTTSVAKRSAENIQIKNYPNPFDNQTEFLIQIPQAEKVTLEIFDASGQNVETPIDGRRQAGEHRVVFNCDDYPAGVYFYRFSCGKFTENGKMILQK